MTLEGQQLGEFEILEGLGKGGMGAVYKARQTSLGRFVALKTLQTALADNEDYIARFRQEAKVAAGLSHPNLVQVYSAGESGGVQWFAMEYVEGESAQARLKRSGPLDPLEAIAIVIKVAAALNYGWRKAGLIHRDIKPDNIFLSVDGEVKLGDLGLAKNTEQGQGLTTIGHSMGTPRYMSPEQAQCMKDVDLRADIYSLGCTLYHLVCGETPYDGENSAAVMFQQMSSPVPDLRDVWPACPAGLAETVFKMMQKLPLERQQSYEEVIADLQRAHEAMSSASLPATIAETRHHSAGVESDMEWKEQQRSIDGRKKSGLRLAVTVGGGVALLAAAGIIAHLAPRSEKGGATAGTTSFQSASGDIALKSASKDHPFVNSLGMTFVPIRVLSGPTAGQQVLFSVWDTRVQDYAAYARAGNASASWANQQKDGVPVGREPNHPVTGVSWEDAQAFCQWLTEKETAEGRLPTGLRYRLPTDEEWSWAVGLPPEVGATPAEKSAKDTVHFPWGNDYPPKEKVGNFADEAFHAKFPPSKNATDNRVENPWIEGYEDGYATTSPVGSFPANANGLYDMGGNVWQWCEDWYDDSHKDRVLRGASWDYCDRRSLLSSTRNHVSPGSNNRHFGFRCVLGVAPR